MNRATPPREGNETLPDHLFFREGELKKHTGNPVHSKNKSPRSPPVTTPLAAHHIRSKGGKKTSPPPLYFNKGIKREMALWGIPPTQIKIFPDFFFFHNPDNN